MSASSIYVQEGYKNRKEYLKSLAEEYDVPVDVVFGIAWILGPNEDFDGLVTHLQDIVDAR